MQLITRTRTSLSLEVNGEEIELDLTHTPGSEIFEKHDDDKIVVGYLVQDSDCENPLENYDGIGAIHSLSRRHRNHMGIEEMRGILESDEDAVMLSYYEHGQCLWDVMNGDRIVNCPDREWDQVEFAGIWVPDASARESYTGQDGKTRREWMVEQAESACKEFTAWCNGDCWGACVDTFNKEGEKTGDDACWGLIRSEYAEKEMREQVEGAFK